MEEWESCPEAPITLARERRIRARRSAGTWLTTRAAIQEAIERRISRPRT